MAAEDPAVIVGGGLMGAASAYSLARRGVPVTLFEQFGAGHRSGSSHGSARIVRRAYADALYVSLTGRAFELWRELEQSSGQPLLHLLGGIDFGTRRDVPTLAALLAAAEVAHEVLPAAEATARWPGMVFDGEVLFHPQAGTLDADTAVHTLLARAAAAGASVHHDESVAAIRAPSTVELADGSSLRARCVVVAAGAWAGPLLGSAAPLPPLEVTEQQVFHFPRHDPAAPSWPSVIHEDAASVMYHLAGGREGGAGNDRKLGQHDGGRRTSAAARTGLVDDAMRTRTCEYVRRWLPGLDPVPSSETTCLYTETPTQDFVLDRAGDVVVCSPCSGHGAKFAPLIGEYVADLVTGTGDGPPRFGLAAHASAQPGSVSL